MPTASTPVEDVLAASPNLDIGNGLITARIAPPDLARGFYRGTRFDQAGVITSLTFKGRNFYGPWVLHPHENYYPVARRLDLLLINPETVGLPLAQLHQLGLDQPLRAVLQRFLDLTDTDRQRSPLD